MLHLTAQRWLRAALGTTGRLGRLNRGFGGAVAVGVGGWGLVGMASCDASVIMYMYIVRLYIHILWEKIYSRNLKGGHILFCWEDSFIRKKLNTKVTKRVVC